MKVAKHIWTYYAPLRHVRGRTHRPYLHEVGQFRIPERNVRRLGGESGKHVRETAQGLVDALRLLEPLRVIPDS